MRIIRHLNELEGKTINRVINTRNRGDYTHGDITIEFTDGSYVIIRPELAGLMTASIYREPYCEKESQVANVEDIEEERVDAILSDENKTLSPEEIQALILSESKEEPVDE